MGKVCTGCGKDRELSAFGRDKSKADGLRCRCNICRKREYRERGDRNSAKMAEDRRFTSAVSDELRELERRSRGTKKACTRCGELKSVVCFSVDMAKASGLRFRCKDCERELNAAHYAKNQGALVAARRREKEIAKVAKAAAVQRFKERSSAKREAPREYFPASITINGKMVFLGAYPNKDDSDAIYTLARRNIYSYPLDPNGFSSKIKEMFANGER